MNKAARLANGLWSLCCIALAVSLVCVFVYWRFLQGPTLSVDASTGEYVTQYEAQPGSVVFLENPIYPPDTVTQVNISAELYGVTDPKAVYPLTHDAMERFTQSQTEQLEIVSHARPGYPVYSIYIPSYVKPGTYRYEVYADYKLNPFKRERLQLPTLTFTIR